MKEIARYPLNNVSGLAIYRADDESVLVGLNNDTPKEIGVQYDEDGRAWFEWGGRVYLDECLRILD